MENSSTVPKSKDCNPQSAIIIGAGPAGLSCADELLKAGWSVTVLEQDEKYAGGLARTVSFNDFRFDIGAHRFFSKNPEIFRWWQERLGCDFIEVKRKTRILYRGRYFLYPLALPNVLRQLGLIEAARCLGSYLRACLKPISPEQSYEDWVINKFGKRLYSIFFRTYTEKVWGIPCSEISVDWAAQRIKGLSLFSAAASIIGFNQNRSITKTLIDTFHYPRLGAGMLWEKARSELEEKGVRFLMGQKVIRVVHSAGRVEQIETAGVGGSRAVHSAAVMVSTMPIKDLVLSLDPPPPFAIGAAARSLRYRDLLLVLVIVDKPDVFSDHWIYIHDPSVQMGRIANFRNWSIDMVPDRGMTGLALDYFSSSGDRLWNQSDDQLLELANKELTQLGIIEPGLIRAMKVLRVEKAYPVLDDGYSAAIKLIRGALKPLTNLHLAGRNGMHKYNNQDHSMLTGIVAAQAAQGQPVDPWKVNIDAEYIEEERRELDSARLLAKRSGTNREKSRS